MAQVLDKGTIVKPAEMIDPTKQEFKLYKKDYLTAIKRSVVLSSFLSQYLLKVVVVFLLAKGVEPWVAVSLPVVLDLSRLIASSSKPLIKLSFTSSYKTTHLLFVCLTALLGFVLMQCTTIWSIYPITFLLGALTGFQNSCVTSLSTQNPRYEPYCLIYWERSVAIGGVMGYVLSQILYDISPVLFVIGFIAIALFGFFFNFGMKDISAQSDKMESIEECKELTVKEKKKIVLSTGLFAITLGIWGIAFSAMEELLPLVTTKVGYVNALYLGFEIISFLLISGSIVIKIKKKRMLMFVEFLILLIDICCLFFTSLFPTLVCFMICYSVSGIFASLADPVWGSIISSLSQSNRQKYLLVNRTYYVIRMITTILALVICRQIVVMGIEYFKYLAIILFILMVVFYVIQELVVNKLYKISF